MTIKTLNYIHQLLIQEAETRRIAYRQARQACADADYDGPLAEVADKAYSLWSEAHEALMDFEAKEW